MGQTVPVGGISALPGQLDGVSADSATDVWAVGYHQNGNTGQPPRPIIVHWNGTAWSRVPCPNPGDTVLTGVSALSPTNAWAVGTSYGAKAGHTFIVHWDGTTWSQVPSPSPEPNGDSLVSVSAVSPANVWAVGSGTSANAQKTLIVHWNGTTWSPVKSPNPSADSFLSSVSAVPGSSAWAVGSYVTTGSRYPTYNSLTLRWNGTAWSRVPSPTPANYLPLTGVSALSRTDAWAVGTSIGNVALHWNGTAWSQLSMPSPGKMDRQIGGVSAVSATDAWAVGWGRQNTKLAPIFTVTARWNGTAWSRVPSPNPGGSGEGYSQLFAVSALSPTDAWAVGTASDIPSQLGIMILHWNGTAWSAAA